MVLRATFVVLCIVAGLALFSDGFDQQGGWMLASVVGLIIAAVVLGIEYGLRNTKTGVLVGGLVGLACGLVLSGVAAWSVAVRSLGLDVTVTPLLADQELLTAKSTGVTYWEGACAVDGRREGRPVGGRAYVEMTGYAGRDVPGLGRQP